MVWVIDDDGNSAYYDFFTDNAAVCSEYIRTHGTSTTHRNPWLWGLLETWDGSNGGGNNPLSTAMLDTDEERWSMWGPTVGEADRIPLGSASTKLEKEFIDFRYAMSVAVRPGLRDSMHTSGKYTEGRETLDLIQLLLEKAEDARARKWVRRARLMVAADWNGPRSPDLQTAERWLERYLHMMNDMFTMQMGKRRFNMGGGHFDSPIILDGPFTGQYDLNFPNGISPRLVQIFDFIAMNPSKFRTSHAMKSVTGGKRHDPEFEKYLWRNRYNLGGEIRLDCFEIFRIVQCDQHDLLVVPCLYDMGIGDWDTLHAGAGKGVWEKGPMKEPGGPARYPPEVQSTPLFQKCYRTGFNLHQHIVGLSGYHLLRIPRSLVCRQFSGRAVVDKNNEPKFGDYIVMLREREDLDDKRTGPEFRGRDMTYKTVQGIDGISDLVRTGKHSEYRDTEFLHVTMSQAALGNKKRGNVGGVASHYDYFNPKKYDGNAGPSKDAWVFNSGESMNPWLTSKADKKVRPFEKARVEELMSWMMGMTTADAENHSIGEGASGSKAKPSIVKIPTWKDTRGRKTLDLTRGMGDYYSDIIRCGECNGRTLVMLPSGNELEACDCPHCSSTGGLNTSHLVEGNPMQPITGMRAHR